MKCIEILETKLVSNQLVVLLGHAQFGNSWPFSGAFLLLGDPSDGFPVIDTVRKRVSVACHWEGSQDEDDSMDFLVSDEVIRVVDGYAGAVASRIGCINRCEFGIDDPRLTCGSTHIRAQLIEEMRTLYASRF